MKHLFSSALLALAAILLPGQANALELYHTDFLGSDGGQPSGWSYVTNPYDGMSIQQNTFRILRPDTPEGAAALRASAVYTGIDANGGSAWNWTNYTVTARLRGSHLSVTGATYGLVARFTTDGTSSGYTAHIGGNVIEIRSNTGLQNNAGTVIGTSGTLPEPLLNDTWYWLSFTVDGENLTAIVYADNDGALGEELGSAFAVNSTFTQGTAGVRGGFTARDPRSLTFDTLRVDAIPPEEPTVAGSMSIFQSVELVVPTEEGLYYRLQSSPDLVDWQNLGEIFYGNGQEQTFHVSIRGSEREFYRVLKSE